MIQGVFSSLAELQLGDSPGVGLGYPLVVHSEELGLADDSRRGVVVVSGLFASRDDARRFVRERGTGEAVELAPEEVYAKRFAHDPDHRIVTVAAGKPVPAYKDVPDPNLWQHEPPKQTVKATAVCTVPAGARFLLARDALLEHYYSWVKVSCDGAPAYIRWIDTLLDAAVVGGPGSYRVRQVIGAECDAPLIWEWPYAERGKLGPGTAVEASEKASP